MLIGGEKWACEACVRGHRVSNCQHADRPLTHINKKGRPVSQCAHCRTLRKSRAAHVKCECGEKTHAKGACTHLLKDADKDSCICCHGGRCSCSLKKEHLDPVPESDSDEASPVTTSNEKPCRSRAHTSQSDHGLTIFTEGGHHKPPHKHNQTAHHCGLPYIVPPRPHSIHGPSPSGLANRSVDNLLHTSAIERIHSTSPIKDSMISAQQEPRLIKSANSTPHLGAHDQLTTPPPLVLEGLGYEYSGFGTFTPTDGTEPSAFPAGTVTSVDWSHYDFNNDNYAAPSYSQAPSFTGFDFSSIDQPALTTTSTSGEISEVEDFGSIPDSGAACSALNKQFGSEASDLGDHDGNRLSASSSYLRLNQADVLPNSNDMDSLNMEDFLKSSNDFATSSNHGLLIDDFGDDAKFLQDNSTNANDLTFQIPTMDDNEALWMNDFTTSSSNNSLGGLDTGKHHPWAQ